MFLKSRYNFMYSRLINFFLFVILCSNSFAQKKEDGLKFPIQPKYDPTQTNQNRFDLGDPSSVQQTIVYDTKTKKYIFKKACFEGN